MGSCEGLWVQVKGLWGQGRGCGVLAVMLGGNDM